MTVKYGKFELPSIIKIDEATCHDNYCRFSAEPFERGFGHTIGNALRRILLNSLEAPAILSVRIEGVSHEYTAIEGIIEDMTHIILNFKAVLLRKLPIEEEHISREPRLISKTLDITSDLLEKNGGFYPVTLKDIMKDFDFDLVNPDHVLFTVTKPLTKKIDLRIGFGRGYTSADRHNIKDRMVDEIIIDTCFSPIRIVNYYVEKTRVLHNTDFDRLILEVTTDGRITPKEALSFATQIGIFHFQVFELLKKHNVSFAPDEIENNTDLDTLLPKLALKVSDIELSVRSANCLAGAQIHTIGELVVMPEADMLRFRNFGRKSLNEIKEKLEKMGLSLGMDLSKFGITRDNIKQIIDDFLAKKEELKQ